MSDQSQTDIPQRISSKITTRMRMVALPNSGFDAEARSVGRYEIIEVLGQGSMGVVYKAHDPLLERIVAVKTVMPPAGVGKRAQANYIKRFEREAKSAAKLQHPSIVTIFDVGVDHRCPFMVLEYLPGGSLGDRLDRARLPLGRAVQIACELASALAIAHREQIVHRDVKPANVLYAGDNRWKLGDFGIARLPDSELTQIGIFLGTPGYAPPEAVAHGRYTVQADIFGWGAVLYELLSGQVPYSGTNALDINRNVLYGTLTDVREHDHSIPDSLAEVVMRALSKDTTQRYQDAATAEAALSGAWESCLSANHVPLACLSGDEVPHEDVGAGMHLGVVPLRSSRLSEAEPPIAGLRFSTVDFEDERTNVLPRHQNAGRVFHNYRDDEIIALGRAPTARLAEPESPPMRVLQADSVPRAPSNQPATNSSWSRNESSVSTSNRTMVTAPRTSQMTDGMSTRYRWVLFGVLMAFVVLSALIVMFA